MGKFSLDLPQGTERAGKPVRLNGAVKRVSNLGRSKASAAFRKGAVMGVVGVISKS